MNTDAKTLNRALATNLSNTLKGLYIMNKWDVFLECKDGSTFKNQSNSPH